jgi:1,4-dihydroxy-6-naphthoate synthase
MNNSDEALRYAMNFARGLDISDTRRFVNMYVNEYTMDMSIEGEKAIKTLLEWGADEKNST